MEHDALCCRLFRLEQPQDHQPLLALIGEVIGWFWLHPDYAFLTMLASLGQECQRLAACNSRQRAGRLMGHSDSTARLRSSNAA